MKQYMKNISIYILAISFLFMSCPFYVQASDHGGGGGTDHNPDFITDAGTINIKDDGVVGYYIEYILSNIGAILIDHDISKAMANDQTMKEYIAKGKYDANEKTVTFPKETVVYVKESLEKYAKENDPYFIARIPSYTEVNPSQFATKGQYLTICNLAKKYGLIGVNGLYMSDMSEVLNNNYSFVNQVYYSGGDPTTDFDYYVCIYDESWDQYQGAQRYKFDFPAGAAAGYESIEDGTLTGTNPDYDYHKEIYPDYIQKHNGSVLNFGVPYYQYEYIRACIVAKTSMRVRVYRSMDDFKKYSVGSRKVYYTEKYYNYVPEDLKVSIDDLRKTVDDLKDVIDDLLGKIKDDTSEQEIMDLLKQILDALRDQQGSGGGGGSGGGDVTVNVDLSETNGFLSKILAKVTQIFDKLSSITFPSMRDIVTAVEDLGKMLKKYLSEITGDLDDIKGQLENMTEQEFSDKMGNFLDDTMLEFSEVGEKAKTKFPFSIPNDINLLISKMSVSPPEGGGGESRIYNMNAADDPGGGMITLAEGDAEDVPVISETGAPIFYLPLVIESAGINEFVIVDMSGFEPISKFCRGLLTIWFVLCLYNMTFKVLGLWGDLVD